MFFIFVHCLQVRRKMVTSKHAGPVLMLGAVVLLGFLSPASALSCHQCAVCDDPFYSTSTQRCTGRYCLQIKAEGLGSKVTSRSCLPSIGGYTRGCHSGSALGGSATVCVCDDKNYCNTSHRLQVLPYLLPLLLLGSYVLLKSQRTP